MINKQKGDFCLQFFEYMSSKHPGNVQEERTGVGGASCHVSRLQLFELELLHPGRRTQWASCVMVRPQEGGNGMVHGLNRQLVSNCNHGLRATDSRKASLHFIFMVHLMGPMCHG